MQVIRRLRRFSLRIFPSMPGDGRIPSEPRPSVEQIVHLSNWFVRMRWIACVVLAILTVLSTKVLGYLVEECFWPLAALVVFLVAANLFFILCLWRGWLIRRLLELQILVDICVLTAMLHFSGGNENPASFAYVFHVIISGVVLTRRKCYATVVLAVLLLAGMTLAEMAHFMRL